MTICFVTPSLSNFCQKIISFDCKSTVFFAGTPYKKVFPDFLSVLRDPISVDVVTSKHYSLVYFSPDMFSLSIRISHNPIKGKTVFWQYKDIIRIGHATIL